MKIFIFNIIFFFLILNSNSIDIYMSTLGNDETGSGSFSNPYLTLMKWQEIANYGDIVYIIGGIYKNFPIARSTSSYNYVHYFSKSGITYKAYNSEKVIFDFEFNSFYKEIDNVPKARVSGFYINEGVENVTFEDFSCTGIPTLTLEELVEMNSSKNLTQSECFQSRGKNIRFNRINAYSNNGIGFYFVGTKSYNIAYRCDSYNNTGLDKASYGNADGFGAHGTGAEFIECRAWDNSDDNYDCINSYSTTIFDSCWAFTINFKNSDIQDGNGFKVGGWGKSADAKELYGPYSGENPPVHIVKNCIATGNKANGFYSNHQPGQAAVWFHNKAYRNKANFDMTEGSETWEVDSNGKVIDICGTREVLFFNFAYKYTSTKSCECNLYGAEANLYMANLTEEKNRFNSWNFENITITDDDFLSIDKTQLANERGEDGSLPEINFMQLNPNGPNYELLKTIEDEMKNYELYNNGTILKKETSESKNEKDSSSSSKSISKSSSTSKSKSNDNSKNENKSEEQNKSNENSENNKSDEEENNSNKDIKSNSNFDNSNNIDSDDSSSENSNDENKKFAGWKIALICISCVLVISGGIFLYFCYFKKCSIKENDKKNENNIDNNSNNNDYNSVKDHAPSEMNKTDINSNKKSQFEFKIK